MADEIKRFRHLIEVEQSKPIPLTHMLFQSAEGLMRHASAVVDESDDIYEEARFVFKVLADRGYRAHASLLAIANCHFHRGEYRMARATIDRLLALEPTHAEALAFRDKLNSVVYSDSKIALISVGVIATITAAAVYLYRFTTSSTATTTTAAAPASK